MYVSEDNNDAVYQIRGYDTDSVTINNQRLTSPFYLTGTSITPLDLTFDTLSVDVIEPLINEIDILVIGCGSSGKPLPAPLHAFLDKNQIGIECMATSAACRSYVILQSEDRHVAGLFFPC